MIDQIVRERFSFDIEFILHYLELLTPFILLFESVEEGNEVFEKMMQIPAKAHALTMEHVVTAEDVELRDRKLAALKANLEKILRNIQLR